VNLYTLQCNCGRLSVLWQNDLIYQQNICCAW